MYIFPEYVVDKDGHKCHFSLGGVGLMDSVGEGEGGKIWENGIDTCKISCMK